MTHLSLSLFGPLRVLRDGKWVVGFESNRVRALLVYLVVEAARPHSREVLAGLLWPELPEQVALANLRYALSNLRKTIGDRETQPPFLQVNNEILQFNINSDHSLDVRQFADNIASDEIDRLCSAASLYQGPFLEGFSVADSIAFEEWLLFKREHFARLMFKTLRRLADHHEQRYEYEQAQQYAWRLVELEPFEEEGHQQLMRILTLSGQRGAALAQYESCRRRLKEELDVEPVTATIELYQRIRDGILSPPPAEIPSLSLHSHEFQPTEIYPPFVARDKELSQLNANLERAWAGHGQVAFVIGEPGSGKTMLIHEFVRRALGTIPDLIAVRGNCNAYTGLGDPYLPFIEMLDMLTGNIEDGVLTTPHARRLSALLPDCVEALLDHGPGLLDRFLSATSLQARVPLMARAQITRLEKFLEQGKISSPRADGHDQQTDLFEQYSQVMYALARRYLLLLVIDDLQWADSGSISLLFHLGRKLAGKRILLVGAYRTNEVTAGHNGERHPLETLIHEFQRIYGANQIDLSRADGRGWVDALLDMEANRLSASFRETLFRHTNGHPLFTVELLRSLQDRGDIVKNEHGYWVDGPVINWEILPPRVEAVIAESVGRLPEHLQSTLEIASVEGEFFTAQSVAQVQAVDEAEMIRRLSGLLSKKHRLIMATGVQRLNGTLVSQYRFRHFFFQKYLYNRLDDVERLHLHRAIGNALESLCGSDARELAVSLAHHFEEAGSTMSAIHYLFLAGDHATQLFANAEAIAHYQRALRLSLDLPDTPERTRLALRAYIALRVPLESIYGYTSSQIEQNNVQARELARHAQPSPELFWVLMGLATFCNLQLSLSEARVLGDELMVLAERLADTVLLICAYQERSITALYEGQIPAYFEYRRRASALYHPREHGASSFQLDVDPEVAGLAHEGWAYWISGYPDRARQRSQASIDRADELDHPFSMALGRFFAAYVYHWCGDDRMTHTLAESVVDIAHKHNMGFWSIVANGMLLRTEIEDSQLIETIVKVESYLASLKLSGTTMGWVMDLTMLAGVYAIHGRIADALRLLDDGLSVVQSSGFQMIESDLYRFKGDVLLRGGADTEAEACFQRAIHAARQIEARSWELRAALRLSALWQRQGKPKDAYQLLAPTYEWFTEGLDTTDLQEARIRLHHLHP